VPLRSDGIDGFGGETIPEEVSSEATFEDSIAGVAEGSIDGAATKNGQENNGYPSTPDFMTTLLPSTQAQAFHTETPSTIPAATGVLVPTTETSVPTVVRQELAAVPVPAPAAPAFGTTRFQPHDSMGRPWMQSTTDAAGGAAAISTPLIMPAADPKPAAKATVASPAAKATVTTRPAMSTRPTTTPDNQADGRKTSQCCHFSGHYALCCHAEPLQPGEGPPRQMVRLERRPGAEKLGCGNVAAGPSGAPLLVVSWIKEGALATWNELAPHGQRVGPQSTILSVNGVAGDVQRMREQLRQNVVAMEVIRPESWQ